MVCCIAAIAVLAAFGKVTRRPWAWIRGRDVAPPESSMPPPARYDVVPTVTGRVATR